MIRCFKCGTENFDGANFCSKCNFKLPKIDTMVAPQTNAPKSARLAKIQEIVNNFLEGEISSETVIEELEKQEKSFIEVKTKFKNMNLPKQLKDEFQGQIDTGLGGMDLFLEAIKTIKTCADEQSQSDNPFEVDDDKKRKILKAIDKAGKGNELLNQCFESSCESMRKAQDEAYIHQDYQNLSEN